MSMPTTCVLVGQLADHAHQVGGDESAGLGRSGRRCVGRVERVDVDGDVEKVGPVECLRHRVGHHGLESALPDLVHQVPAHALVGHPLPHVLRWPVAAQADLDEVAAGDRAAVDQPAHRRAMTGQVAVDGVGGVGVGVEVHHADVAVSVDIGDRSCRRPGDGVVATHRERNDPAAGDLVHAALDVVEALLPPCRAGSGRRRSRRLRRGRRSPGRS